MNKQFKIHKVFKFIENYKTDYLEYQKIIKATKRQIAKLKKGAWNSYFYEIYEKKQKINLEGIDCEVIYIKPLKAVIGRFSSERDGKYSPEYDKLFKRFLIINDKYIKLSDLGTNYYLPQKGLDLMVLRDLIKMTPIYKKNLKYIRDYSEKEIKKIVKHLKVKFKGFDYDGEISANTNPEHWY